MTATAAAALLAVANCTDTADVVVWGGTVCGATASVAVARANTSASVLWLVNGTRLGGMTSGGLGGVDLAMQLGGLAKELFAPLGRDFEPHVAEAAVEDFAATAGAALTIRRRTGWLTRVWTEGSAPRRVAAVSTMDGRTACGRVFIDCSYEGDLLRLSGSDWAVGREAAADFGETLAGTDAVPFDAASEKPDFFEPSVSPFADAANTTLLPTITRVLPADEPGGQGDDKVMSYCFRMCLTDNSSIRVPVGRPEGYSVQKLELLRREITAATRRGIKLSLSSMFLVRHLPNGKIDLNSGDWNVQPGSGGFFPFSTDLPFQQFDYPLGAAERRAEVFAAHVFWTQSILHYLSTDAELRQLQPALVDEFSSYGLCGDEFEESDHWPPQLYVRESVRMRGARVMTQSDVCSPTPAPTSVGVSKWQVDIHPVERVAAVVNGTWRVVNAGGRDSGRTHTGCSWHVEVPYEALIPRANDTANIIVPVCASFTHVAFATYRLEPQYAVFGHAAGAAAALACAAAPGTPVVQNVSVAALRGILKAQGQILTADP